MARRDSEHICTRGNKSPNRSVSGGVLLSPRSRAVVLLLTIGQHVANDVDADMDQGKVTLGDGGMVRSHTTPWTTAIYGLSQKRFPQDDHMNPRSS